MRILHTSDWHLGQKLIIHSRESEQQAALDWLLQTVIAENIDLLVVSGDIFDTYNPPISAENQYFSFLARLIPTQCKWVVITGGNHDSPLKLNAPRSIMEALSIHVVGEATADVSKEIIELKDAQQNTAVIVAAVPFLREYNFKIPQIGIGAEERRALIKKAIAQHFEEVGELCVERKGEKQVPVIGMAHLYAAGAVSTKEKESIYLQDTENIQADAFPAVFDYVALGHIHRAQVVAGNEKIRYCGSLLPMSFSERKDEKIVLVVDFEGDKLQSVRAVPVPVLRRMVTVKGSYEEVLEELNEISNPEAIFEPWVDVLVTGEKPIHNLNERLREDTAGLHLRIVKNNNEKRAFSLSGMTHQERLSNMTVDEVFLKKCEAENISESETTELLADFKELQELLRQNEI